MSERFTTIQQLADHINNEGVSSFMSDQDWNFSYSGAGCDWYLEIGSYTYHVECVHEAGGGEGGTEAAQSVFKVDLGQPGEFLRINYSYYSHVGYDFESAEAKVVGCREVMVKVYD